MFLSRTLVLGIIIPLAVGIASVAIAGNVVTNRLSPKDTLSNEELEKRQPDNSYPIKIYNEKGEMVLKTKIQNWLDNKKK